MEKAQILVIDDEPEIRRLIQEILSDEGYAVRVAEDASSAAQALLERRPDLVLLDVWLPDMDGIQLLQRWKKDGSLSWPVVMMSGHGTIDTAVQATRLGAFDYLEKPLSLDKLLVTIDNALKQHRLVVEHAELSRQEISEPVGDSEYMRALRERTRRAAETDHWILITGEPGVGKEVLARYLHALSKRAARPFVVASLGAMSAGAGASVELFGSENNGKVRYGLLEQANGGTLFITDIADMDPQAQKLLVQTLHSRALTRVGGAQAVPVNVRVVAATSVNLAVEVHNGDFREDLYQLLSQLPLYVAPLRDHGEDIPVLLDTLLKYAYREDGLPKRKFTAEAEALLLEYPWPGNVREMRNLVQRILILGNTPLIGPEEVRRVLNLEQGEVRLGPLPVSVAPGMPALDLSLKLREARDLFEKQYLEAQLSEARGSMSELARRVGMERTHLYRKLRALGISIERERSQAED